MSSEFNLGIHEELEKETLPEIKIVNYGYCPAAIDEESIERFLVENGFSGAKNKPLEIIFTPGTVVNSVFGKLTLGSFTELDDKYCIQLRTTLQLNSNLVKSYHAPLKEESVMKTLAHELSHLVQASKGSVDVPQSEEEYSESSVEKEARDNSSGYLNYFQGKVSLGAPYIEPNLESSEIESIQVDPDICTILNNDQIFKIFETDNPMVYWQEKGVRIIKEYIDARKLRIETGDRALMEEKFQSLLKFQGESLQLAEDGKLPGDLLDCWNQEVLKILFSNLSNKDKSILVEESG